MNKNLMSVLAVLIIGYGVVANSLQIWPFGVASQGTGADAPKDEVCAQVITFAVNPQTGEIEEFPTPCDVPDGWEVVEADILNQSN